MNELYNKPRFQTQQRISQFAIVGRTYLQEFFSLLFSSQDGSVPVTD